MFGKKTEADATSIDAWAMEQLARLIDRVRSGFEAYRFRQVHEAIFNFCNDTLSDLASSAGSSIRMVSVISSSS